MKFDQHPPFERALLETLNEAMLKAAEPVIEQALKDIERAMRERLAARLIGLLESNMDFSRNGTDLVIRLRQEMRR